MRALFFCVRYNELMALPEVKYAIYPGTVATYDEEGNYLQDVTWSAVDLATAYGVENTDYLVVNPTDLEPANYFEYIHLKPRGDGKYINMLDEVEDIYRPDFDAKKKWTEETDPRKIDPEMENDLADNQRIGDFQ